MMKRLMKKIDDNIPCIDFVNSDLSRTQTINGLARYLVYCLKGIDDEHRWKSTASFLRSEMLKGIERLKGLQKNMKQFVNYSIAQSQGGKPPIGEYHKLKNFIRREADKITYGYKIGPNIVENVIIPYLCEDMIFLDNEECWDRIINCSECKTFFIARTSRHQMYCSKKCRDKHRNKERIKSGKWARYMKDWRRKRNDVNA